MAKTVKSEKEQPGEISVPLEWNVSNDIVARYATNMVVQRLENEFLITFFEVKPPILLGEPDQIAKRVKELKSIQANCVAQVIVAADKMPSFVKALETNLQRTIENIGRVQVKE
jgi:hypothetical protein